MPKRSRERGSDDAVTTTATTTATTTTTTRVQQLTSSGNNNNTSNNNNNGSNNNNIQNQNTILRVPSAATIVEADQSDTDVKQLAIYDVILQVSQAHQAHCGFTEESTRDLIQKPMIIPVRNIYFLVYSTVNIRVTKNRKLN